MDWKNIAKSSPFISNIHDMKLIKYVSISKRNGHHICFEAKFDGVTKRYLKIYILLYPESPLIGLSFHSFRGKNYNYYGPTRKERESIFGLFYPKFKTGTGYIWDKNGSFYGLYKKNKRCGNGTLILYANGEHSEIIINTNWQNNFPSCDLNQFNMEKNLILKIQNTFSSIYICMECYDKTNDETKDIRKIWNDEYIYGSQIKSCEYHNILLFRKKRKLQ